MIAVKHSICGKVAFYLVVKPSIGQAILPSHVRYVDGSIPKEDSLAICSSCNKPVDPHNLNDYFTQDV